MAWTAPKTWIVADLSNAADMNTYFRDNMLETASAKATAAGDIFVATGANAIKRIGIGNPGNVLQVNSAGNDIEYSNTLEILSLMEV
jgi:hypothetical protein